MRRLPSSRLAAASFVLAAFGVAVTAYLTLIHYRDDLLVCAVGGCHTVQNSPYSEVRGVPVALFGLGMFVAVLGLGILRWRKPAWREYAAMAAFCLAVAGSAFALYLTYVELFVVDAVCQWCVLSALLTWSLAIVEGKLTLDAIETGDAAYD